MRFVREVSIPVSAPQERVFAYLSDIARHGEWAGDRLTIRRAGDEQWQSHLDMGMLKADAVITVERSEPPDRFTYVCRDSLSGTYRWTFELRRTQGGTRLTHRVERLAAPLLVKLIQPWLMWPLSGRPSTARGLENIKHRLEAAVEDTAGAAPLSPAR